MIGWLDLLMKGKTEEQAVARTEIAMILEQQGNVVRVRSGYASCQRADRAEGA